jgi:peptidoglycan/LPS O-acetylase OafA/YrhL
MTKNNNEKLAFIDCLRILSAFSVLIWHFQHFYYCSITPVGFVRSCQPLYRFLSFFYNYGAWGVQVFWCISGFVFFTVYFDRITTNRMPIGTFLTNRFSRLYPLHLVTLTVTLLLQRLYHLHNGVYFVYQFNDLKHFILQLPMASHWGLQSGPSFNGPIWSVSVEIGVYVLFWATLAIGLKTRIVNIVYICIGMVCVKYRIGGSFAECVSYFYAGGLTAQILNDTHLSKSRTLCYSLIVIIAEVVVMAAYLRSSEWFIHLLILTNIPVLLCVFSNVSFKRKTSLIITKISDCTYSTYLLHFPLQLLIALLITTFKLPNFYDTPVGLVSYLGLTYYFGQLSFNKLERPLQEWIRQYKLPSR